MASRLRLQPVAIVLIVIAIILIIVGIIYLTQTADNLPGFIPGSTDPVLPKCNTGKTNQPCYVSRHYSKRGIAALGLAAVAFVGAWYTSGLRRPSHSAA
jgi:hypothetical protein